MSIESVERAASPEFEASLYREAVLATYEQLLTARQLQSKLNGGDETGGRPFVAEGTDNQALAAYHVRFGVKPRSREAPIAHIDGLIIRVALTPEGRAPLRCVQDYMRLRADEQNEPYIQDIVPPGYVPTADISIETVQKKGRGWRSSLFLLTPQGPKQYRHGDDVVANYDLTEVDELGRLLDLDPARRPVSPLRGASLGIYDYMEMMYDYTPFSQEATPPYLKSA